MTYLEARKEAAGRLEAAGVESAVYESGFLLNYATGQNSSFYLLHQLDEIPQETELKYRDLIDRRCSRIPLQHLTGEQEFMGLSFLVNEHVLIPRQDTEILAELSIETIRKESKNSTSDSYRVLDLCTGSGCLALSMKSFCPDIAVTGSDISGEALKVAKENGKRLDLEVEWLESDLFSGLQGPYDLIVSNPPYIPSAVIPTLMPEVRLHEPMSALDGTGDGLFFYREITKACDRYLKPGGWLLYEIGYDQAEEVMAIMKEYKFTEVETLKDPGGLDRVVKGRRM